jgi:hypothetical protein
MKLLAPAISSLTNEDLFPVGDSGIGIILIKPQNSRTAEYRTAEVHVTWYQLTSKITEIW